MAARKPLGIFAAGWRSVREAGSKRLLFTGVLLLAALLLARFSWSIWFTDEAERALYDAREYYLSELVEPDQRVVLVTFNDFDLQQLQKRSPLPRDTIAAALRNIDTLGAKAIGIDILFDQRQDEDLELVETLNNMQTPVAIGYADIITNDLDIEYEQQAYLDEFLLALESTNTRAASIRLAETDGVTRVWPEVIDGTPPLLGRVMLEMAGDAAVERFEGYEGAIRFRRPEYHEEPVFPNMSITAFSVDEIFAIPEARAEFEEAVRDSYVLIGGDIIDYDRVLTPLSGYEDEATELGGRSERPAGITIHAATIAQMLDGERLQQPSVIYLWALSLLVVIAATLTALLELRNWKFIPLLVIQVLLFIGLPFFLHDRGIDTHGFPAVGPALGWIVAFTAVTSAARASGAVQRKFAQGALGKYLPQSIADEIIEKPELLSLGGEKREIYVLFSDLEGFTKMSHAIAPEMVAKLLNRYLEMLSDVVLEHGGILDKFIGDAVVAFWGAPISRPDDAQRAAQCGYAIWQAGEAFREEVAKMDPGLPPIGKTRVGLHFGEAVVGNFGGENRIQYTALGDSMNTAARLESGNKTFKTSVMASREFASRSGLHWWRRMGKVVLSGRSRPVDLYEPAPHFPEDDNLLLGDALDMLGTARKGAIKTIEVLVRKYPDDEALAALLERCRHLNEDGAYVMAGK
ncbi:adenylate/guanylate cyclase domain-containing protein [Aurantiacibacter sp. D1-12]|uniref:adenylate/guanylate cyclase domain-containing protein n=1 Tax=Aurantiacibacter sp. D1-12 TaxID=2993658 RepID=UPI00237D20D5|nr:adenylate/guanylate cyclase domain-containing protein [Aurantiacibacter sp. D1-12]MDE1467274.1 adenylate/guanylate cyclase domain-containing protein [Aurantiacibacter sp. D1-12]